MCVSVCPCVHTRRVLLFVERGWMYLRSIVVFFPFLSSSAKSSSFSFFHPSVVFHRTKTRGEMISRFSLSPSVSHIFHSFSLFPSDLCRKKMKMCDSLFSVSNYLPPDRDVKLFQSIFVCDLSLYP